MDLFSNSEITDKGVRIRVLFFTKTILFRDIKSVQRVPFWKVIVESMHPFKPLMWTTGDIFLGNSLIIETADQHVAFSPNNCDEFLKIVSSHLTIPN